MRVAATAVVVVGIGVGASAGAEPGLEIAYHANGRIAFQRTHLGEPTDTGVFTIGTRGRGLKRIVLAGHAWSADSKRPAYMVNGVAG